MARHSWATIHNIVQYPDDPVNTVPVLVRQVLPEILERGLHCDNLITRDEKPRVLMGHYHSHHVPA
jgi:hypothetical protein